MISGLCLVLFEVLSRQLASLSVNHNYERSAEQRLDWRPKVELLHGTSTCSRMSVCL